VVSAEAGAEDLAEADAEAEVVSDRAEDGTSIATTTGSAEPPSLDRATAAVVAASRTKQCANPPRAGAELPRRPCGSRVSPASEEAISEATHRPGPTAPRAALEEAAVKVAAVATEDAAMVAAVAVEAAGVLVVEAAVAVEVAVAVVEAAEAAREAAANF
jgi:hypothetical protein